MFNKYEQLYHELDYQVVPLKGKRPFLNDWVNRSFEGENHPNCNIGLKTGKHSNVICIDIDTTDEVLKNKIYALLPPLLCGKTGNKDKGHNYFFEYNGEVNEKIQGVVELLSTGNQTVLPPSIHPEKQYPYEWVGTPLLSISELSQLPKYFMDDVRAMIPKTNKENTFVPEKGRCVHGSHIQFSEMVVASLMNHHSFDETIRILLDYDEKINPEVSFFLCKTGQWKTNDKVINANQFVLQAATRLSRKEGLSMAPRNPIIVLKEEEEALPVLGYKKHKLPKLRGIAQELFEYIYEQSPVSRTRLAYASTISIMGTLLSNKTQLFGIYTNIYSMIIAPSGSGKNYPLKFPSRLFSNAGINYLSGLTKPASDSAVLKSLTATPNRLDCIDEMSSVFIAMNNSKNAWQSGIQDAYAELFTSPGYHFSGKNLASESRPIGECFSPCVSLLGAMTIEDFKECFTRRTMDKGLGGRFLYFVDDENKDFEIKEKRPIPHNIINFCKKIRPANRDIEFDEVEPNEIDITTGAKDLINVYAKEINKLKSTAPDSSKIKPLLNRVFEQFIKFILIDTISMGGKIESKVTIDNVEWAYKSIIAILNNTEVFLSRNLAESVNESILLAFESAIRSTGTKGMTLTEMGRESQLLKLGLMASARRQTLITLEEDGRVISQKEGKKMTYLFSGFVK